MKMLPYIMAATSSRIRKGFFRSFKTYSRVFKYFRVLGIETSCDDTGAAVVDSDRNILGEAKFSQSSIHALHGGILPNFAETLHKNNIKKAVGEALEKSKLRVNVLDAIAVTVKPGILCNLSVGVEYAKDLCTLFGKPLIPIHHMEAHALTIRLVENVEFPFLVLLLSGGHCILAVADSILKYRILGESLDTTPGVILDKISRRLKLSNLKDYRLLCGGAAIEKAAEKGNPLALNFTFPERRKRSCNFTFSGHLTAVLRYINEQEKKIGIEGDQLLPNVYDICASFQFVLARYISERLEIAINHLLAHQTFQGMEKTLVVSGGVASNEFIRKILTHVCDSYCFKLLAPPKSLCTDNGVMIAWNGIEKLKSDLPPIPPQNLKSIMCIARSPLGEIETDNRLHSWKGEYVKLRHFVKEKIHEEESINSLQETDIKN